MKSFSAPLVALAVLVAGANAQFQINTPNPPVQCIPTQFTWTGGTPPYFLQITPGGVAGAAALQQYPGLTGTSFTWTTNISSGTSIGLSLTDSTGSTVQSAPVTIQNGPDSSCLNGGSSSAASGASGSTTAGASTTGAAGSTTAPGSTTAGASSGASGTSTRASSTSRTSSSSSSTASATGGSSGALSNVASAGLVGVLGAVAAAILA